MELQMDLDVKKVLEFMQEQVPVSKLEGVADALPKMARLLWSRYPQEPCVSLGLVGIPISSDSLPAASESSLA